MVVLSVFWWCSYPIQIHGYILNILHTQWIHFIVISAFTLVEIAISALKKRLFSVGDTKHQISSCVCCLNSSGFQFFAASIPSVALRSPRVFMASPMRQTSIPGFCTSNCFYPAVLFKYIIHWAVLFLKSKFFSLGNLPYFTPAPSIVLRGKKPWTTWALNLMRRR